MILYYISSVITYFQSSFSLHFTYMYYHNNISQIAVSLFEYTMNKYLSKYFKSMLDNYIEHEKKMQNSMDNNIQCA